MIEPEFTLEDYDEAEDARRGDFDDDVEPRRPHWFGCADRMCGALDCPRCRPELIGADDDDETEDEP